MIFNCPSCSVPIGDLTGPGTEELICSRCRFKYRIITGSLRAVASRPITVRSEFLSRPVEDKQLYELQLEMTGGARKVVAFDIDGRHQALAFAQADLISIVYSLRDEAIEELLRIVNQTSGTVYELAAAGERSRRWAGWLTTAVGTIAFVVLLRVDPAVAFLGGGGIAAGSYFGFKRLFAPTAWLRPDQQRKLAQVNTLLQRKQDLESQLRGVEQDRTRKVALQTRLLGLRAKMESVDPALYQTRIEQLAAAESTVNEQIGLDDRLIDGYRRSVSMLEIEVETNAQASELPEDIAEVLRSKAEQLAAIREQNRELELQLEANQEVERLLKGS